MLYYYKDKLTVELYRERRNKTKSIWSLDFQHRYHGRPMEKEMGF